MSFAKHQISLILRAAIGVAQGEPVNINSFFQKEKKMETKERRTRVMGGILALVGLLLVWTLATAGNLEPSGPPASTMKTLDEIYDAVVEGSSGVSEREGYCQSFEVDANSTLTLLTVPTGKRLVFLNLNNNGSPYNLRLTVNDTLFIDLGGLGWYPSAPGLYKDFPDRCVIVDEGATLKCINTYFSSLKVTIIGYFYDVE
jgi:hypothetical protein